MSKDNKKDREIMIGLEIHVQLNTKTKLFCSCTTKNNPPNTNCCEICLGHPGSKPVLNKEAFRKSLQLALALNCEIADELVFSRKSYFYPDLAKNFQVSQYELPLGKKGYIEINGKKIHLTRIHMEEDPASLVHPNTITTSSYSLIDYNRSGIPLCEIVTEPDISSPEEARLFMKKLITILDYLNIYENEMVVKADANVSVKESGFIRAEVKNISSFKEIERALKYEIERQKKAVKENKKLVMETRAWHPDTGRTSLLRKKETDADYGYIIDPDLCVYKVNEKFVNSVRNELPLLPEERKRIFIEKLKLKDDDAEVIADEKILAEMLEETSKKVDSVLSAKWIRREVVRIANYHNMELRDIPLKTEKLVDVLYLVEKGKVTDKTGKEILQELFEKDFDVKEYVRKNNLEVIQDTGLVEEEVKKAISNNLKVIEEFKSGKENALNYIVGQVMRATKGKANPKEIMELIKKNIK